MKYLTLSKPEKTLDLEKSFNLNPRKNSPIRIKKILSNYLTN